MSAAENKAVFLSYASQDAEAAKRICDALRAVGVEVWFDQSELVGGDAWDAMIRKRIKECALFVPIITPNTNARAEGYFRLEWKLAVDRSHLLADDHPFLFPVVIGDVADATARVPDKFREVQWTRVRLDESPAELAARVVRLLSGSSTEAAAGSTSPNTPVRKREKTGFEKWWWLIFPIIGMSVPIIGMFKGKSPPSARPQSPPHEAATVATVQLTEAQKLVRKVRVILDEGDEINRENYSLAEELLKRAEVLDPTEATAWALHAQLSASLHWFAFDVSSARREAMRVQAARALTLAPESADAQLAAVRVQIELDQNQGESLRTLQALVKRSPENWQAWRQLARCMRKNSDADGALAALRQALELSANHLAVVNDLINHLTNVGDFAEADRVIRELPAGRTSARLLAHDLFSELYWRGNPAAAADAVTRWPSWFLAEDRGAGHAALAALWNRNPARAQKILTSFPRDYLRDYLFTGPRAVLSAWANEQAGNAEAAQADWKIALRVSERILGEFPDDREALYWKAWALARLGDRPGATAMLRLLEQREPRTNGMFFFGGLAGLKAALGDIEGAVDLLANVRVNLVLNIKPPTKAFLMLNPVFDPLRNNPRFQALIAAAPGPEEKKEVGAASAIPPDKSVAVLAFANLSDDKANEYFSDGISEELLNVLAKVPGLKVSARTSAFHFKGKDTPIPEIARQLGVAYVVEGSVRKAGDKVRITAQLIKAADGFHVWSDSFTRDLKDIFAVQDEIAGLIAQSLQLKIGASSHRREISPAVLEKYLTGRSLAAASSVAAVRESIVHLKRALDLDPEFTGAWVQIARNYVHLSRWGALLTPAEWDETRRAAARAEALDPTSPDVQLALGWVRRTADWNWKGAELAFREAQRLRPDHPETLVGLGVLLANLGQEQEAVALAQRAATLDPLNAAVQMDLLVIFYCYGRYEEAVQAGHRAVALAPSSVIARSWLARSLIELDRFNEAQTEIDREENWFSRTGALARLRAKQGRLAEARALLAEMEARAGKIGGAENSYAYIANVWGIVGDAKRGMDYFEKTRTIRDPSIAWARTSFYAPYLKSDPRWPEFLRSVGLADDQLK